MIGCKYLVLKPVAFLTNFTFNHLTCNVKEYAKYFGLAFLLFAVVGFINGWSDRPETARDKLYREMTVVKIGDRFYFELTSESLYRFYYSVDSDSIESFNESLTYSLQYFASSMGKTTARHNEIVEKIGAVIGPTAGISVSAYSVIESLKKPRFFSWKGLKNNLSFLIGSVSGYLLGEWAGANIWTGVNSDLAATLIREDRQMWQTAEKKRLIATLLELQTTENAKIEGLKNVALLGDDPVGLCECPFNQKITHTLQQLIHSEGGLNSEDFDRVEKLKESHDRARHSQPYDEVKKMINGRMVHLISDGGNVKLQEASGYNQANWEVNCLKLCELLSTAPGSYSTALPEPVVAVP